MIAFKFAHDLSSFILYLMFAGRSLIDFASLFSPYDFKKNELFHIIYISSVLGYALHI